MKTCLFRSLRTISIITTLLYFRASSTSLGTDFEAVSGIFPHVTSSASTTYIVGWEFAVETPIIVDALGIYTDINQPGFPSVVGPTSAGVSLWDGTGNQLASCQVLPSDATSSTGFKYHLISSIMLQPGQDYTVGCLILNSASWVSDASSENFAPGIDFVARRFEFASNMTSMPTSDYPFFGGIPVGAIGGFGASFTFVAVPEPSVSALAGLSIAFLIFFRPVRRSI
jgi:hypothetical protein